MGKLPPEVPLCVLQNRLARGEALEAWAALRASSPGLGWESVYYLTRTYFIKDQITLWQEKGVKGENELPQRVSILKR